MTFSAFARRVGVSLTAVQKAAAAGRLKGCLGRRGKRRVIVDVNQAEREWRHNRSKPQPVGKKPPPPAAPPVPVPANPEDSLAAAQRRVSIERARALHLATEQKLGNLLPAEQVKRDSYEAARLMRDAMLNIPARVAAELAAETDAHRLMIRLEEEIRSALDATVSALEAKAKSQERKVS